MMTDGRIRSVLKGVTWRVIATMTTILLVYIYTGSLTLVAQVGVLDVALKFTFYYAHDRAWSKTSWGIEDDTDDARSAVSAVAA